MERSASAPLRLLLGLAVFIGLLELTAPHALAQAGIFGLPGVAVAEEKEEDAEGISDATFPAPDRETLRIMNRVREALKQAQYVEAVEGLDHILNPKEDKLSLKDDKRKGFQEKHKQEDCFFRPDSKSPIYRSLRAEARQLIGRMPGEGRQLYELKFGQESLALLRNAVANRNPEELANVARRYFHTRAGYEATFLLGLHHLDQGAPLAGALMLRQLRESPDAGDRFEPALSLAMAACCLQAGMPEDAERALLSLKERHPKMPIVVGGRQVPWFEQPTEALAWLERLSGPARILPSIETDQWALYRGDATRNASTKSSTPLLNMRWRIPITDDPGLDNVLTQLEKTYRERGAAPVSSLHPLAVGDVVLMRDAWYLWAIDFHTGKRLWTTRPLDDDPWQVLGGRANANMVLRQQNQLGATLGRRLWDDATYGTLSSDGRLVYCIEDLGLGLGTNAQMGMVVFGGARQQDGAERWPSNRLAAYDIRTGKVEWEVGGTPGPLSLPLAETFFLGPPLPLRGQLFVLAETKDEIQLMVLDSNNKGKVLWTQQLAMVERNVSQDPFRRLAGVSPSYADGILICPTGAGAVVAVDMATRSLLWGYRYPAAKGGNNQGIRQQQLMAMRFGAYYDGVSPMARWLDGTAAVVDGRVILTPPESDALHCLKLIDGQPAWEAVSRRQEDLYVACVHKGMIVLVGRNKMRAVKLADGKPAWEAAFPTGASVTGRGIYTGTQYYVPLSSAEVAAIDLDAGKTAQIAKSRKGNIPGNLICHKGKIISQGLDAVETFYQIDAAREEIRRRLAAKPEDAEALSLRGEMLMDEGKAAEAVASFRRAYELDADPRTRELLRDALLDGLRADFAGHRNSAAEIEGLLDDTVQRAMYLRLMAAGLQKAGEWPAALEQYFKLAELDPAQRPLEQVDRSLLVRRDRWLQTRLAELRRAAGKDAAGTIDQFVEARLKTAMETQGVDSLENFLENFGNQPAAAAARRELLKRLVSGGRLLEAELLLWPERYAADRAAAGAALAELAELFAQSGKHEAAADCYRELAADYGGVPCRDGKTGKQLLDMVPKEGPARPFLAPPPTWPVGQVESKKGTTAANQRSAYYGRYFVSLQGNAGPFYAKHAFRYDQNRSVVLCYDELGREKWQVQLTEGGQRLNFGYNPNMTQTRVQGHLVLMAMGTKILALDPQALSGGTAKLLWSQDLTDGSADSARAQRVVIRAGARVVLAGGAAVGMPQFSFRANPLGPVTSRYVCFIRFRNLVAVDPASGEPLWIRQDIPQNSEVFGDEQYVFVLPPDQSEAMVLRAEDGELLGKRAVPRPKNRQGYPSDGIERANQMAFNYTGMADIGRYVLIWDEDAAGSSEEAKPSAPVADAFGDDAPAPAPTGKVPVQHGKARVLRLFDPWEQKELWPSRKFAAGAKVCLVNEEAAGVFEPDGHLVIVELPSGRTIADVKLQSEDALSEIFLTRLGEQYFLLTHDARVRPNQAQRMVQQLPGMLAQPIRRGHLYALDLQGKVMWPAPVTIEDQQYLLSQPVGVPVLVFGCQKYEQQKLNGSMTVKTSLVCVDRRTGRIAFNESYPNHSMSLDIVGNPDQKTVELRTQTTTVVMTLTDKPLPPLPPGGETTFKPGQGKVTDALLQTVGDQLGKAVETMAQSAGRIAERVEARIQGDPVPAPPVRRVQPLRLR